MGHRVQTFADWIGGPAAAFVQLCVATKSLFTAGVSFWCWPLPILKTITGNALVPACALKLVKCLCKQIGRGWIEGRTRKAQRSAPLRRIADVVSPVDAIAAAIIAEPGQTTLWVARKPTLVPLPAAPTPLAAEASTSIFTRRQLLKGGRFLAVPGGALSLLVVVPRLCLPRSGIISVPPVPSTLLTVSAEAMRLLLPGAVQLEALLL